MLVKDARIIWENLNSIICVYKPSGLSCEMVRRTIINAVCTGLNEMECRPLTNYVSIEGNPCNHLTVSVKPNMADHPLVVGPRYQHDDVLCSWSNYLGRHTSGVLLLGLRHGTKTAKYIRENRPTRSYRIQGRLGESTEGGFAGEKVIEKSTWRHVREKHIERLLSTMQTSHQKEMFKLCGVDMQSQAAYDMSVKGLIRPSNSKIPLIYGIKCTDFQPPDFTVEIQCANEYETYLKCLIAEIGYRLHSTAHCTAIQCIRHSHFTVDHSLLRKHWHLQEILANMEACKEILHENSDIVRQESATLMEMME